MESAYVSPYREGGEGQLDLHTKHYLALQEDIHYQKGMMCQDCHTTYDLHGDGFLKGTTLAQVEIECADCHGTPFAYPWELPLGYLDEFETPPMTGPPRGVAQQLTAPTEQGTPLSERRRLPDLSPRQPLPRNRAPGKSCDRSHRGRQGPRTRAAQAPARRARL